MAKLKDGLLGAFIGKIGPVIASRRGNTVYLKSRPAKVKQPNTPKQLAVKKRFGLIASLGKLVKLYIRAVWVVPPGKAAYNAFISANLKTAAVKREEGFEVDYAKVVVSTGEVAPLQDAHMAQAAGEQLQVHWTYDSSRENTRPDDQVSLLAVAPAQSDIHYRLNAASRSETRAVLSIPEELQGETLHVYASVRSPNGKKCSDSVYVGQV